MQISLSITTLIFIVVVCISGGIVIATIFQRARQQEQESMEGKATPAVEGREQPSLPPAPSSLARPGEFHLMGAWRTPRGQLWLEVGGKRFERKEDLPEPLKKALAKLVLELHSWLDLPAPASAPTASISPSPSVSAAASASVPVRPMPAPPPPVPKADSSPAIKSIVQQIDDILQDKLLHSPFAGRKIRLTEGLHGVVLVEVDNRVFEGIDAVPDAEIRALIRQAVTEWERAGR